MKADKYLEDIGLENVVGEEFFNSEDNSYYTVEELMESYHKHRMIEYYKKRGTPFTISDPDMPINDEEKKAILKAWEACKPKFINSPGIMIMHGTSGADESGIDFNKFYDDAKKEWRSTKGLPKKK